MENLRDQLASLSSDDLLAKLPNMLDAADTELIDLHAQISALNACVMILVVAHGSVHPVVLDSIIEVLEGVNKSMRDVNTDTASNYIAAYDSLRVDIVNLRESLPG